MVGLWNALVMVSAKKLTGPEALLAPLVGKAYAQAYVSLAVWLVCYFGLKLKAPIGTPMSITFTVMHYYFFVMWVLYVRDNWVTRDGSGIHVLYEQHYKYTGIFIVVHAVQNLVFMMYFGCGAGMWVVGKFAGKHSPSLADQDENKSKNKPKIK